MSTQSLTKNFPLPMQYLGSKQRISDWLLNEVSSAFQTGDTFVDLMSGSGSVAHQASNRGYTVVANDIQPYSYAVLLSAIGSSRDGINDLITALEATEFTDEFLLSEGRGVARDALKLENEFFAERQSGSLDWREYQTFCQAYTSRPDSSTGKYDLFTTYYPNTYFGVQQCLEIDALKQFSDELSPRLSNHLIASLISAMTFFSSTTTHLAQFLKPTSATAVENLLSKRSLSVKEMAISRLRNLASSCARPDTKVFNLGYEEALRELNIDGGKAIIYVDPPYFKEHYSRYYHVLDTMALYDYPSLTFNNRLNSVTAGLYRDQRIKSDFGLRSKAPEAFRKLFAICAERDFKLAISYASTSLVTPSTIYSIAEEYGYQGALKEMNLRHSGQGQVRTNSEVTEYLFLFQRETANA